MRKSVDSSEKTRNPRVEKEPDYDRAVDIITRYALKRLIAPDTIALITPIVMVGIVIGPIALGGMLIGAIITGPLLGLFQGNVGNTWDNAKKFIEKETSEVKIQKYTRHHS